MLNNMILQGRFTKDLELKHTKNDIAVCSFVLAWSEKYGEKEQTLFLNCVAYKNNAEFITKYFKKGDMVAIEGKLTSRSYEDKEGQKKYVTELIVDRVHFCGNKKDKEEAKEYIEEDLPF